MACRLVGTKPFLNQYWNIVDSTLKNKLKHNVNRNSKIFLKKMLLEISPAKWQQSFLGLNELIGPILIVNLNLRNGIQWNLIKTQRFSFKKTHLKISSANCGDFVPVMIFSLAPTCGILMQINSLVKIRPIDYAITPSGGYAVDCHHGLLPHYSHDGVMPWKHLPHYWPFVRGIHRWPVDYPHKEPVIRNVGISLMLGRTSWLTSGQDIGELKLYDAHVPSQYCYGYKVSAVRKLFHKRQQIQYFVPPADLSLTTGCYPVKLMTKLLPKSHYRFNVLGIFWKNNNQITRVLSALVVHYWNKTKMCAQLALSCIIQCIPPVSI